MNTLLQNMAFDVLAAMRSHSRATRGTSDEALLIGQRGDGNHPFSVFRKLFLRQRATRSSCSTMLSNRKLASRTDGLFQTLVCASDRDEFFLTVQKFLHG